EEEVSVSEEEVSVSEEEVSVSEEEVFAPEEEEVFASEEEEVFASEEEVFASEEEDSGSEEEDFATEEEEAPALVGMSFQEAAKSLWQVPEAEEESISTEDLAAIDDLLKDIHLPSPVAAEPCTPNPMAPEEVEAILEKISPSLPPLDTVSLPRDTLYRSLELLATMEELTKYLQDNYQIDDPLYVDLLASMLTGVRSLQNLMSSNDK
ncbi:MAG: hypothetical protein R3Y63_12385, partial [Eubacteriales bacterium]